MNVQLKLMHQQPDPNLDPTQAKQVPLLPSCWSVPPLMSTGGTCKHHCTPPPTSPQVLGCECAGQANASATQPQHEPSEISESVLLQRQHGKHAVQVDASAAQSDVSQAKRVPPS